MLKGADFFLSQGSVCFSSANKKLFCDSKSEKVKLGQADLKGSGDHARPSTDVSAL